MRVEHDKPLEGYNTLRFSVRAEHFVAAANNEEIAEAASVARDKGWPVFVLGGGSNLVLTQNLPGLVIHPVESHIQYTPSERSVTVSAGVPWHRLVESTLAQGNPGLENLSLIPGSTGAAPVQNIGAYGVELADRFQSLEALHLPSGEWQTFDRAGCEFAYRDSLFKRRPGEYLISAITLEVGAHLPLETRYASLAEALAPVPPEHIDAATVSNAVCRIRRSKLPDPLAVPNVGSFFKNPVVDATTATRLHSAFDGIVMHPQADGSTKVAAGWLIDSLGFRGLDRHGVGVHADQALVLVHHGNANGQRLMALADEIRNAVLQRYGVLLETEPVVI